MPDSQQPLIDATKCKYVISSAIEGTSEDFEERELRCPKCGCEKIVFLVETKGHLHLGSEVRCYECGHEFTVTENCWKPNYDAA
jgi:DNA-directed RNA polymerase subunit RPC12/RpoP